MLAPVLAATLAQSATNAAVQGEPQRRGVQLSVNATVEILEPVTNSPQASPRERQRQVTRGRDRITIEYF